MAEHGLTHGRGTFSCRIDGRAGYLQLWDDRLELVRSGRRGPEVLGAEVIPMYLVTQVSTGKPGRLFTALQLVAAGGYLELKLPSIDAPRVADLIELLVSQAPIPADLPPMPLDPMPLAVAPPVIPAQIVEPVTTIDSLPADFVMPDFSMKVEMPEWTPLAEDEAPAAAVDLAEVVSQREYMVPEVEMPTWTPLPAVDGLDEVDEVLLRTLESPRALANPAGLTIPRVEMPQWTPLPETDQPDAEMPEMVLSQIVLDELNADPDSAPVVPTEPMSEIEPLPEGSVLAAAAALAELESMLNDIPLAPTGVAVDPDDEMLADAREIFSLTAPAPGESDGVSIPAQPSKQERPTDLPPDLERRLAGLEVLRNCGIMSDEDFAAAEAELLESLASS